MRYDKEHTSEISFPMGGIGAGCIGLAGNGHLVDWEIFNKPNKFSMNGLTHFAVRAEKDGEVEDFRILQGDMPPPYSGQYTPRPYVGFGYGILEETLCNWPHFREHTFEATFPVATITFGGERFPGVPTLTGWSVLIPGDSHDSSLPAAFLEVTVQATAERDFTVIGVLDNPWPAGHRRNHVENGQLTAGQSDGTGEVTLTIDGQDEISYQTESYRGSHSGWRDHQEKYYHDVMAGGRFHDRRYETPDEEKERFVFGLLAAHFHLKAGESHTVRFVLTWHCTDNCPTTWSDKDRERAAQQGLSPEWKPWYTTVWKNARESGRYAMDNIARLREETFRFRDAMAASTLPDAVLDGATASLAVLKSPTCLRLEDGTFWGWEGVGVDRGSCPGSCTHVWNYTQALPFLFPDLERSMRVSHLKYGVDALGGHHFRCRLPLGLQATTEDFRPCADGQFGEIMKFYRDWRLCGDDAFLRQWWPTLKKMLEYAWNPDNPDKWDPERSGVLTGRQHHTLDMELFGTTVWLEAFYLGALKAMSLMARHLGEEAYAAQCDEIYARGRKYVEEGPMFNGEFFTQVVDLDDRDVLAPYAKTEAYWDEESGQLKYQIGQGCEIDQPLAQGLATAWGLGDLYSPELNRRTLLAILKYNFLPSMRDVTNLWRTFCLNDEAGVMICTWPKGGRPVVPLPYHSEMMTGFEWAFAFHLVSTGLVKEGERVAAAIRERFDGHKRNPWNEIECGSNYARCMAAFGLFNAYSHFTFGPNELGFDPSADMTVFWSIGTAWGTFTRQGSHATLRLLGGSLDLERLRLPFTPKGELRFQPMRHLAAGDSIDA